MNRTPFGKLKIWILNKRHDKNGMVRFLARLTVDLATFGHNAKSFLTQKQARAVVFTKLFRGKDLHQSTPATGMNRFPVIFSGCRDYFQGNPMIRILSFGCSTGEEVFTLRQYFPDATIVGAEINPHSLEICRQKPRDENMVFIESTPENIQKNGPYDAIFCMAVFQRTPQRIAEKGITDLKRIYPFSKFEREIAALDKTLKPSGLMVVHFSQYDFMETAASKHYRAWGDFHQDGYSSPIFDKESRRITEYTRRSSVFVKDADRPTQ